MGQGQGLALASEACDITAGHLIKQNASLLPIQHSATFYARFRDDVVVVLDGRIDSKIPAMFETTFNQCAPEYEAKFSWDSSSIISLDVKITRHGSNSYCETAHKPLSLFAIPFEPSCNGVSVMDWG